MARLHLFTSLYERSILLSDTKKMNFLVLVNDQLEKGIKRGQGGSEQKQKSHSDLKENDIHSKSAVILAFSSFYDFSPFLLLSSEFFCPSLSIFHSFVVFPRQKHRTWGKGSGKGKFLSWHLFLQWPWQSHLIYCFPRCNKMARNENEVFFQHSQLLRDPTLSGQSALKPQTKSVQIQAVIVISNASLLDTLSAAVNTCSAAGHGGRIAIAGINATPFLPSLLHLNKLCSVSGKEGGIQKGGPKSGLWRALHSE